MHRLFVYGTLQHPVLLDQLLARVPASVAGTVDGYRAAPLQGRVYPGLLADGSAAAHGRVLLDVTDDELDTLDRFEGPEYERTTVVARTADGEVPCDAWVLVGPSSRLALPGSWSYERFLADDAATFVGGSAAGEPHPGWGP